MFEIVYPEDGEKYAIGEFHTVKDCKDFVSNLTKKLDEIKPSGDDKGAFVCHFTGAIIVIREAAEQHVQATAETDAEKSTKEK